jgi:hypothetical protein
VLQTLPWHERFLEFQWQVSAESPVRRFLPPDRVWLAMMRHAGDAPLANQTDKDPDRPDGEDYITFDKYGTFELRYQRYRRYGDHRDALPYQGELDRELYRRGPP